MAEVDDLITHMGEKCCYSRNIFGCVEIHVYYYLLHVYKILIYPLYMYIEKSVCHGNSCIKEVRCSLIHM